jgi:hypothetical protein
MSIGRKTGEDVDKLLKKIRVEGKHEYQSS